MNLFEQGTHPRIELYCEIPLTRGQIALIDPHRFEEISIFSWHACWDPSKGSFYAARALLISEGPRGITTSMHRQIMGLKHGDARWVDHIQSDRTLDNRSSNLRLATPSQNAINRRVAPGISGFKGVRYHANNRNWEARITLHRRTVSLGIFDSPEEAYAAYCAAAPRVHGEFARLA